MPKQTKPIIPPLAEQQVSSLGADIKEAEALINFGLPSDTNQDLIITTLAKAATDFLKNPDFISSVLHAFQQVGSIMQMSSVLLAENSIQEEGVLCFSTIASWSNGVSSLSNDSSIIAYERFGLEFSELSEGIIYTNTLSDVRGVALKQFMEASQSLSILVIPIFVNHHFWGTVFLDDKKTARKWTQEEKDIITAFASMIGAAIERKQMTENLLESEERFRTFADATPVMIWMTNEADQLIYINKTWTDFTGKDLAFLQGKESFSQVHPDDREVVIKTYQEKIIHREEISIAYRLLTAMGTYKWVLEHAKPRFLLDGSFVGYIGNLSDIDLFKKTQTKEAFQSSVIQHVLDAVITTDANHQILSWNKSAEVLFSEKESAVLGKLLTDMLDVRFTKTLENEVLKIIKEKGSWAGEVQFTTHKNRELLLQSTQSIIIGADGVMAGYILVFRDLTEQRASMEALRISEERYRSVIDALNEGIVLQNKDGQVVSMNQAASEILGLTWEQMRGVTSEAFQLKTIREDGSDFPGSEHPSMQTLATGKAYRDIIMGVVRENGEKLWISVNSNPVFYSEHHEKPDAVMVSFNDITEKRKAIVDIEEQEIQIKSYTDHIQKFMDSITDAFFALNIHEKITLWNTALEKNTGLPSNTAIGKDIELLMPWIPTHILEKVKSTLQTQISFTEEYQMPSKEDWLEITTFPSNEGVFVYLRNITERKRQEMLIRLEKKILEMNTATHALLKTTVDHFLKGLEEMFPGFMCAVNLHHEETSTMEPLSAPSLPTAYTQMVTGMHVGPDMGSCGAAIFYKRPIIVHDIAQSELWKHCIHIAAQFNFKASWAYPIFNAQQHVLGTFSVFLEKTSSPKPEEEKIIERAVQLLKRVIEFKLFEEKIKASNERYLLATMATNDAIWDADLDAKVIYWAEGFHTLFGYQAGSFKESERTWELAVHPNDLEKVEHSIQSFIASKSHKIWQEEYRFRRADGRFVLVVDRGFLIFDQTGKVTRMVGSMQDITEKRELESKLIKQEVNRHKFVTQAVVDAQEKERSEIGKELHDNVNQILSTAKLYLEVARNHEEDREKLLNLSAQYISVAINEIRSISKSLVPTSIGDIGLVESIQDLMESVQLTKAIKIHFNFDKNVDQILSEQQKLMLYRIIQEQMNNVLKHAKAQNFTIEMMYEDGKLQVIMTDDGIGFDPEQIKHKKGVGLFNINSRVELFHGKADIFSSPGAGCTIMIQIPITQI